MKKTIIIFITGLFILSFVQALEPEKLTNSSIIKMTKAKLADDIILDEINSSAVKFTMSDDSIKALNDAKVSPQVIQAMKLACSTQTGPVTATVNASVPVVSVTPAVPPQAAVSNTDSIKTDSVLTVTNNPIQPVIEQVKDTLQPAQPTGTITEQAPVITTPIAQGTKNNMNDSATDSIRVNALVYVAPMNNLVQFYTNEFDQFNYTLAGWDRQIKDSLMKAEKLNLKIMEVEKELNAKKNADSKAYSQEILFLKKTVTDYRARYKQLKNNMLLGGLKITKDMKTLSSDKIRSTSNKISEVSQQVNSTNSNPANGENAVPVTFIKQKINNQLVGYVAPSTQLLAWYQNENNVLKGIIIAFNNKITPILQKDVELANQLNPLKSKLEEYKLNSKKYKSEISGLKKQITALEKERKQLSNQMDTGKKQLSTYLKQLRTEVQNNLLERFNDIIENINYYYQEKLNI